METKWTPGEWRVRTTVDETGDYPFATYDVIAIRPWGAEGVGTGYQNLPNALIQAAAPAMYAMLEAVKDELLYKLSFDETSGLGSLAEGFGQQINALLKKARGEKYEVL